MEALEIRGSSTSRIAASRHGHRSSLDDVAAADHTGVKKCTRQSMADRMKSTASPVPCRAGPAETAKPCRIGELIPKSWDGSHEKGQFRNFMAELHLWMQAW